MTIIIDVMGGPGAPEVALKASAYASLNMGLDLLLVGDESRITAQLSRLKHNPERLMVRHADPGDDAARASIDKTLELLGRGLGIAAVTSGDAHTTMSAADKHLERIDGIERAALCAVFPTVRTRGARRDPFSLILDVGATHDATAQELVGFARMGSAYASRISRNSRPRVALLVSEASDVCGPPSVEEAAKLLDGAVGLNYVGGIGGVEIPQGGADVVVCSGFVGNIVIQLLKGVPYLVNHIVESLKEHGMQKRLALRVLDEDIGNLKTVTDWRQYGGAPLLGYDRPVIVTQGDVDEQAFRRAIKLAAKAVREDIVGAIRDSVSEP